MMSSIQKEMERWPAARLLYSVIFARIRPSINHTRLEI